MSRIPPRVVIHRQAQPHPESASCTSWMIIRSCAWCGAAVCSQCAGHASIGYPDMPAKVVSFCHVCAPRVRPPSAVAASQEVA